jgi:copper transporter 1
MFAGSCIGVICLVLILELLRRVGREYDAFILRRARLTRMYMSGPSDASDPSEVGNITYQSVSTDDTASKTTDCDRCCKAPPYATTQDDAISTAPDSSSTTKHLKHNAVSNGAPILAGPLPPRSGVLDPYRPSIVEQIVRALLHMLQFAVAYFIMLLAMYFNGYIIICIFIGAFLGSLIFSWEPVSLNKELVLLQNRICLALDGPGC